MDNGNFILIVGGFFSYFKPFEKFGMYTLDEDLLDKKKIKFALFCGGEDINPGFYGEKKSLLTSCNFRRDEYELGVFKKCIDNKVPMVGICRGAQLLCALSGGRIIQHVEGHGGSHEIELFDGRKMIVSSTHHQMQLLPSEAKLIAWASPSRSRTYINGDNKEIIPRPNLECEISYFPNTNCLCMQHHPEMMSSESAGFKIAQELCEKFIIP